MAWYGASRGLGAKAVDFFGHAILIMFCKLFRPNTVHYVGTGEGIELSLWLIVTVLAYNK